MFCNTLLYVHSSISFILMGKRELVASLNLSSWCLVVVVWLFLTVPWACLQFVIVVFPDHTHLLILYFSPFLKIALTFAVLQSLGTIPVSKLRWKIVVNIDAISLAISFNVLAGSRPGPVALLGLSLSSSLKTPSLVSNISGMAGKGWPSWMGWCLMLICSWTPRGSTWGFL